MIAKYSAVMNGINVQWLLKAHHKKQKEERAGTSTGKSKGTGKSNTHSKETTKLKKLPSQLFSVYT